MSERYSQDFPKPQKQCCELCKFWFIEFKHAGEGDCRRHAPIVFLKRGERDEVAQAHPETRYSYFCGDYEEGPDIAERTRHNF